MNILIYYNINILIYIYIYIYIKCVPVDLVRRLAAHRAPYFFKLEPLRCRCLQLNSI